jgi:outer membrane protein assembly factor BamB
MRTIGLIVFLLASALLARAADGGIACWRGPEGSGVCPGADVKLVDDLSRAKQLWVSEDRGCSIGYSVDGAAKNAFVNFRSGYASPVAVDGRVYFAYFVPAGWDPVPGKDFTAEDLARAKELATSVVGDDVIVCMDAATGKTLWRQVFKGNAIHWNGASKYGTHITPCVADGKVFALGSCGGVYGLDAKTGAILWQGTVGDAYTKHKAGRDAGSLPGGRYHFSSSPSYAEGVALFNDHSGGLLGLDAATGKELYRTKGAMGYCTSPVRWPCGDRTYVIAHGRCYDPKTGKLLWKADTGVVDGASGSFAVSKEYMLVGGFGAKNADQKALTGVSCFRIDEKGATKLWALEAKYRTGHSATMISGDYGYFQTGTQLVCVELATGKVVHEEPVSNANPCTAPIAYAGRIIMMHRQGVQLFSDGADGMKRLGAPLTPPREGTITPYAADGKLFFRGPNYLYGYDLRQPTEEKH